MVYVLGHRRAAEKGATCEYTRRSERRIGRTQRSHGQGKAGQQYRHHPVELRQLRGVRCGSHECTWVAAAERLHIRTSNPQRVDPAPRTRTRCSAAHARRPRRRANECGRRLRLQGRKSFSKRSPPQRQRSVAARGRRRRHAAGLVSPRRLPIPSLPTSSDCLQTISRR